MFWDGAARPSVEVPLGDFFGIGFGLRRNFVSLPLQMSPQDGRGFNCWFPMPFARRRALRARESGRSASACSTSTSTTRSTPRSTPSSARFHAWWNRTNPHRGHGARARLHARGLRLRRRATRRRRPRRSAVRGSDANLTGERNYVILDVAGRGHYVGCNLNIDVFERQVNDWYGEGDDMIFIDGEPWPPRLHGTGTEDYFNTAFCPTQEYCAPYHGITVYSGNEAWPWGGKNSMYRFHVEDPIRFERSIRVTIETGHDNALANDYSSTAYWYQVGPASRCRRCRRSKHACHAPIHPSCAASKTLGPRAARPRSQI